jgi:hypothetical protein
LYYLLGGKTSGSASWMSGGVDVGAGTGGIWSPGCQVIGIMIVMLWSWIGADMSEVWRVQIGTGLLIMVGNGAVNGLQGAS